MLTKDFNGEPYLDGSTQLQAFDFQVGGILNNITKRLYDRIPASQRGILSRADYMTALKTEAVNLLNQEYDPSKQNMDSFLSNRLNLRANSLATELGVTSNFNLDIDDANNIFVIATVDTENIQFIVYN